jgi:uncharacterized protein with ParB-like and HNH nuclease domain
MKVKHTRFRDIPQFTRAGSWECSYSIVSALHFIDNKTGDVNKPIDLNPDFQREHVWTPAQQIAWLEFFLRGGKTGRVLYFNCPDWHNTPTTDYNDFVVVDGKQRIQALRRFVGNEIKAFGSYFREYTDNPRVVSDVLININDLQTKAAVLQWYLEMNAGGTPHSPAEIQRVRKLLAKEKRAAR